MASKLRPGSNLVVLTFWEQLWHKASQIQAIYHRMSMLTELLRRRLKYCISQFGNGQGLRIGI